jgi:hypothetical protein
VTQSDITGRITVARRLADSMRRQGISNRGLARALAGGGASKDEVETQRRAIVRWLGGTIPNDMNARRLALALGEPPDAFVSPRPRRVADGELGELAEELAALSARVGQLEESLVGLVELQRYVGDELQALQRHPRRACEIARSSSARRLGSTEDASSSDVSVADIEQYAGHAERRGHAEVVARTRQTPPRPTSLDAHARPSSLALLPDRHPSPERTNVK